MFEKFLSLNSIKKPKIGVVGDSMMDQYYHVDIKKISPEFPIPVMHSTTDRPENRPGGAANVVYQFKNFNVDSKLISFVDNEAKLFFESQSINTDLCLLIENNIPRKRRFYSDEFPTYRWDVELDLYGFSDDIIEKCSSLSKKIAENNFDALIFSDYEKGVFYSDWPQNIIKRHPLTIIDPKSKNIDKWRGCSVFKPNAKEAQNITGIQNLVDAGKFLKDKLECKAVVITNSGSGILVITDSVLEIKSNKKNEVKSVIGAGDCFISFLALFLSHGFSIEEAAPLSWEIGLKYVKNSYNKPIEKNDLLDFFDKKIHCPNFLNRDYRLVFTNGCFDGGLTAGHIHCLKFAKEQGDKLIVGINSDSSIKKLKGQERPFVALEERLKIVAALEFVDYVVPFDENDPLEIIKKIKPDVIVKGGDYNLENVVGKEIAEVRICPKYECLSTTEKSKILGWKECLKNRSPE